MEIGLLWFDNDPNRGITAKIEDAALRYREKFGRTADTCYVNSAAFGNTGFSVASSGASVAALRVVPAANILPHHFWVGEEEGRGA